MTTLNLQVTASTDDAWENAAGTVNTTGATIGTLSTGNMWGGFRFLNVTVPNAATINAGTQLQVYINSTSFDDLVCDVYAQAIDDAATFSTSANDISSRSLTTAKTSVNATAIGVGWYVISLTSVIQEIVNRAGWVSGNDIAIIIDALGGINFQCRTWDNDTTLAAKLDIDYTAAATSFVIPRRARTNIRM